MNLGDSPPQPPKDDGSEMLEAAKRRGFLILPAYGARSRRAFEETNNFYWLKWRAWCRERGLPLVWVEPRVVYATVDLELEPAGRVLTASAGAAILDLLHRNAVGRWRRRLSGTLGRTGLSLHNVPMERAKEIAGAVLCIALEHSAPADPVAWPPRAA